MYDSLVKFLKGQRMYWTSDRVDNITPNTQLQLNVCGSGILGSETYVPPDHNISRHSWKILKYVYFLHPPAILLV